MQDFQPYKTCKSSYYKNIIKKENKAMKRTYNEPKIEVMEYAQFENVFTWCNRGPNAPCVSVDNSGNAATRPADMPPQNATAHGNHVQPEPIGS